MEGGKARRRKRSVTVTRSHTPYPYPVYFRSPLFGAPGVKVKGGTMGVTTVIKDYGTEILNAIRENDLKTLKSILEKNLKVDHKIAKLFVTDIKHRPTKKFACPLILAARQEDPRIINYMLVKGTDPNFIHHTIYSSKRREIITALHIASDLGFYDTVETLLNANADCNISDHNQETPLHIAVKKADRVMVRMMLSRGADPNILDRRGNAALHIATLYGHLQMVRSMLKYDADVYQQGQWGAIPPQIAAKEGHIHLIQLFCSRDVGNINIKIPCYPDKREKAPIHLAAENGHVQTVLTLLDQFEAEVNLRDSDGNTALHCVVLNPYDPHRMCDEKYFTETARVLIKNRISINEKNSFGDSALHLAAMNHYHRIVELLLSVGANPFAENNERLKPIDVVPDSDPVTKQLLKNAMLNPKPPVNASSLSLNRIGDLSFAQLPGRSSGGLGTLHESGGPFQTSTMKSTDPNGNLFPRNDPQNFSFRSVSSMSSVFVDEVQRQRMAAKQRKDQGLGPSDSALGQSNSGSSGSQNQQSQDSEGRNVYHQIDHENEIPVYTKVDKDKKSKGGSKSHQESSQDTLQSMTKDEILKKGPATIHNVNPWEEDTMMSSMITDDTSFDTQEPAEDHKTQFKNKLNKKKQVLKQRQQEAYLEEDSNATEDVFQEEEEDRRGKHKKDRRHRRDGKQDERIYENLTIDPKQFKKNRKETQDRTDKPLPPEPTQVQPYQPHGVHIQHPTQKPGTIEVQYSGGPITISVDTMMNQGMGHLPPGVGMGPVPPALAEPKTPVLKEIESVADEDMEARAKKERKKKRREKEQKDKDEMLYANQEMLEQRRKDKRSKKGHSKVPQRKHYDDAEENLPPPLPHKRRDKNKGRYLYQNEYEEEDNDLDQYVNPDNMYANHDTHYMNVSGRYGQKLKKGKHEEPEEEEDDETDSDEEYEQQGDLYVNMEGASSPKKQDVSGVINGTMNLNETDTLSGFSMESQPPPEEVRKTIKQKIEDMTGEYKKRWKAEEDSTIELPESWKDKQLQQNLEEEEKVVKEEEEEEEAPEPEAEPEPEPELVPEPSQQILEDPQTVTPSKKKKKKKDKKCQEQEELEMRKPMKPKQYDDEYIDEPVDMDLDEDEDDDQAVSPQYRTFAEKKRLFAAMLHKQQAEHDPAMLPPSEKPKPRPRPKPAPRGTKKATYIPSGQDDNWTISKRSGSTVVESTGIFSGTTVTSSAQLSSSHSEDSDADSESSSGDEEQEGEAVITDIKEQPQPVRGDYYTIAPDVDADETSSNASSAQDTVINLVPNETRATEVHQEIKMERVRVVVADVKPREFQQGTVLKLELAAKETPVHSHEGERREENMEYTNAPGVTGQPTLGGVVSPVNFKDILSMRSPPLSAGSMSPSSFISDGSMSRLNLRVTGNVPKAYTRGQKDSARRAFIKAAPVGIESGSEASDTEGLSGSMSRLGRNSRTSLTEMSPPNPTLEGIRRHSEWSEPLQPVVGPTKHPLSPTPTSSTPTSPPPGDSPEDGKKKLIGSYAKPYKSFGKIDAKTDLIDEYMQDIPEEEHGEHDPMRIHDNQGSFTFDSSPQANISLGSPESLQEVVKPYAVKFSQPSDDVTHFQTVVSSPRKQSLEERSSPVNASDQSAFSTVGQEKQGGLRSALSPTPRGERIRSPKSVSIREENFNEKGEKVETITTTVVTGNASQAITITAQDVIVSDDDDDDDDEYFDDDSFDEDQEVGNYSEEPGAKRGKRIKRPTEKPPAPPDAKPDLSSQQPTTQSEKVFDEEEIQEEMLLRPSQIKAKIQQAQEEHGLHPSLFENMEDFNKDPSMRRGRLQSVPPRPKLPAGYKPPQDESPRDKSPNQRPSSLGTEAPPLFENTQPSQISQKKPRPYMKPEIVEMSGPQDQQSLQYNPELSYQLPGMQGTELPPIKEQKSFGPEDEEVAEISAAADAKRAARKEKRRQKKEAAKAAAEKAAAQQAAAEQAEIPQVAAEKAEAAAAEKAAAEEAAAERAAAERAVAEQAAAEQIAAEQASRKQEAQRVQGNPGQGYPPYQQTYPPKKPGQYQQDLNQMGSGLLRPGEPYNPGKARPGAVGTTIFIDGEAEVSMVNTKGEVVAHKGQSDGGFLKFPSLRGKKKKKDKDKSIDSLTDDQMGDDDGKKKKKKKKKERDQEAPSSQGVMSDVWHEAMSGQPLASSETRYDQQRTPHKADASGQLPISPSSPEEQGIYGTVMGAKIERGDTVKKGQAGAYSNLKREKAESMESLDENIYSEDAQKSAQEQALLDAQGQIGKSMKNPNHPKTDRWSEKQNQQGLRPGDIGYRGNQHYQLGQWDQYQTPAETNLDDYNPQMQLQPGLQQHGVVLQETNLDDYPQRQQQVTNIDPQQQQNRQMGRRAMGAPHGPRGPQRATETNIDDDLPMNNQPIDGQQQFENAPLGAIIDQQHQQSKRQMGRRAARQAQGHQGAPAGFPGSRMHQPQVFDPWAEAQLKQQAFVDEERMEEEMAENLRRDVDAKLANIDEGEPMDTEELRPIGDTGPSEPEAGEYTSKPFQRSDQRRKSKDRKKGGKYIQTVEPTEDPAQEGTGIFSAAPVTSSQHQQPQQPYEQKPRMAPEDDAEALSKMWKQRKEQEAEMTRVLQSMSDPEVLDELPPGNKGQPGSGQGQAVRPQYPKGSRVMAQTPPGTPKPTKPPKPKKPVYLKARQQGDKNVQSLEDAALTTISGNLQQQQPQGPPRRGAPQNQRGPGPQGFLPGTYKPPQPLYSSQRSRSGSAGRPDDAQLVSDTWSQQNKAEVVEMKPPSGGRDGNFGGRHSSSGSLHREGQQGRRPGSGRPRYPQGPEPRRHHSLADVQSDSEAMHQKRKNKSISFSELPGGPGKSRRGRSRDTGHHSETEMQNYEPPRMTDPGKSLQDAALETIKAGLKDQKKISPRRTLPHKKRPINYTRGVYRPNPVVWRGSQGSKSQSTSGRYDDSQLISQLWAERSRGGNTDTEGEADTEDVSGYYGDYSHRGDDSYMEGPPGQMVEQMCTPAGGQYPGPHTSTPEDEENKENMSYQGTPPGPGPYPQHGGPSGRPPVPQSPRRVKINDQSRKRKKKRREKPDLPPQVTEPGPVDFSQYSDTARLWMEQVDQNTVKKSKTMYLSVMPEGKSLPDEFTSRVPQGKEVDSSHQWVIARGRSIRQKKRKLEEARRRSAGGASDYNTSGAESDWEPDRPMSPGRQLLIFFRVGGNWRDLAWVLFDGIQSDGETIRMTKDIELKHPEQLTDQVHDLMHRWWKKKGSDATIEELQRALELVNMIYIQEEYVHHGQSIRPSVTSYTSEEELDISQIEDDDPDVSRLIQEYNVRSLNASFDVSSAALKQHLLEYHPGVKADNLSKKLYGTGLVDTGTASATINRDRMASSRGSLGKRSRSSGGPPDSSMDPLDYDSDSGRKHSFVIVQPQLKSEDYKHETAI